ncbi:uncharacterized protein LOC124369907 [Homalodisca vitripennis]|uniref:DUF4802 domain-containing protein n=1 Tax=Homalodisca liturata TaxID=320908 RepID=A0A1B6IMJ0_9HEMI|nr:uncharacterized protein LOC124369907 [Homalodisca vitripennis]
MIHLQLMGNEDNMDSNSTYNMQSGTTQLIEHSGVPSSPPPSYEHVLAESNVSDSPVDSSVDNSQEKLPEEEKSDPVPVQRQQIIHKSSKELYKAVAAQWGITCKMSDHCRCLDCQSHYLDCEYDRDEQEKTDGGLGAGTPMFLSEVMHGSACNIL